MQTSRLEGNIEICYCWGNTALSGLHRCYEVRGGEADGSCGRTARRVRALFNIRQSDGENMLCPSLKLCLLPCGLTAVLH